MDNFFEEKIEELAKCKTVLDVGGGGGFQKGLEKYKPLFNGRYVSLDYDVASHPDIVGDAQNMPIKDCEFDGVLCISVLEHVPVPQKVVDEIYRVLVPGGKALIYAPFLYPYHAKEGVYDDFFRFSKDGLRYLFRNFSEVKISPTRYFFEAWFNMFPKIGDQLSAVGRLMDKIFRSKGNQASGFNVFVVK